MKNGITHIWRQLAAVMLGMLGFSSCERIGWGVCMYGEPHADFKALGTVSDENGKPIEGIRVAIQQHRHYENTSGVIYDQNDWYENDTLYTDDKGAYQLIRSVFESPNDVKIVFEDIDGEENGGEYMSSEATPEVKRTKKGDNSWYGGAFEVQADVKLIDLALRDLREKRDSSMARKLLELGCQKIDAIYNENPQKAREIGQEIAKFAK